MLMPPFNLHHPKSVEEACELASTFMAKDESFDWVAGGTDLLPNYKWHINVKKHVISLAQIEGIDTISMHEIGAMARLGALTTSNAVHPLIAAAASKIASSLIRNNATLRRKYLFGYVVFGSIKVRTGVVQLIGAIKKIAERAPIAV